MIRGNRVTLRLFAEVDADREYLDWLSDDELMRFSQQAGRVHTVESTQKYRLELAARQGLFLSVRDSESDKQIGTLAMRRDYSHGTNDLSLMIGRATHRGRGFGLDAWTAALRWSVEVDRVRKVTGGAVLANTPMIRIMERSGMSIDCIRPQHLLIGGRAHDVAYYGLLADS